MGVNMKCRFCLKGNLRRVSSRYLDKYMIRYVKCDLCGKKDRLIVIYAVTYEEGIKNLKMFKNNVKDMYKLSFGCDINV